MPLTNVHMRKGASVEKRRAIADAVHQSLMAILGIPEQDRFLLISEYDDENFYHAPAFDAFNITYSNELLIFDITFLTGRSDDVKKGLIADLNRRLVETAGVRSDDVFVSLHEEPPANLSFGQGITQKAP